MSHDIVPIRIKQGLPTPENGIIDVLKHFKPFWQSENIDFELLPAGFINTVWLCCHGDEKLIVRVNPDENRMPFVDRDYEARILQHLSDKQLVPKYYGRFENGLVYSYAHGQTPDPKVEMLDPKVLKLIIHKLYLVHQCDIPPKGPIDNDHIDSILYHYLNEVMEDFDESLLPEDLSKRYQEELPNKQIRCDEAEQCRHLLIDMYSALPRIFCHQDLWPRNIVYDKNEGTVNFLDWEMATVGVAPMDLASLVGIDTDPSITRKWIRMYMETAGMMPLDESVVSQWETYMLHTTMVVYLGGCSWSLWNCNLAKEYSQKEKLMNHAIENYKGYIKLKKTNSSSHY